MTDASTDALVKPDMQAVLSRTYLAHDLHGFMLPVLEAISNAIDSINARFGDKFKEKGTIEICINNINDPTKILVRVTDNGIGLTDENYTSFKTPFSGYKLKQKGRGFGRFISFKVYSRVIYLSRYEFFADSRWRAFRFDINQEPEFIFQDTKPDFTESGLCVEFSQPLIDWRDLIRSIEQNEIIEIIGSHFLPYFLYRGLPKITIQFDGSAAEDITDHFKDVFIQFDSGDFKCEIDGVEETLTYSLTRITKNRQFKSHCLLLSAADRIVGFPRDLTNKLGQSHFLDENSKPYIVVAVVRGEAFENRLNDPRTNITLSAKTIESIVSSISDAIQSREKGQIEKIKSEQSSDLNEALKENPILRLGLRGKSINDYVSAKPNHWKAEQFVSDLAVERFRATADLTKQITAAANDPIDYERKIKDIVEKLDSGKKEALAEYVIHRKNIISLVESARKFHNDGKRSPEDTIHELVFRRFSDNVQTGYFEHNLWLIDDALSFLPYISSDRSMHGKGRKIGDKVTDLVFFDDSMLLGDEDGTTLTIVEFKRPSRDDYRFGNVKSDPVEQVIETVENALAAGGITKTDGSHISLSSVVRRFAFIIADITPSLHRVLKKHDFKNDWNPKIYVRYRDNERIFIQAFGYETLIELAKKRNQAFFSVLLDE